MRPTAAQALHDRPWDVINEFADRADDAKGRTIGLLVVLHRQHLPDDGQSG